MILDVRNIAHALGGTVTGRDSCNVPGPNHDPKDRSLSIKLNARAPGGFVVFSHAGDNPIECRDYVRQRLGMEAYSGRAGQRSSVQLSVAIAGSPADTDRRKSFAVRIWNQALNPLGTVVERYLRETRGLALDPEVAGRVVRYHGRLKYGDGYTEGMVCLFRDIKTDEPVGIHRTFLTREAQKIDRRMLGVAKGAAIKIDAHGVIGETLTIGEGFETTLAGRLAGFGPVWALGSAGAIGAFPVLVREITILGENDATSRRFSNQCVRRYLTKKRAANVVTPRTAKDFNDAWREAQEQ